MAQHLTEEEQIETLKRWWADNGRSVVIGIVLAVVGYFGWQGWQTQQQQAREEASLLYEDLTETVITPAGETLSEEQRMEAESIVEELKADYGNLLYASNAALLMAKVAVEHDDLDAAEQHLRWAMEQNQGEALGLLARERLARVLYARDNYDEALALLEGVEAGAYASAYAELRGDILLAQDREADAKAAYQTALDELPPEQSNRSNIIQMKLDSIQVSAAPETSTSTEVDS